MRKNSLIRMMSIVIFLMIMFVSGIMASIEISSSTISALFGIFITSATAAGIKIVGINWLFAIGYLLSLVVIPCLVAFIKKQLPNLTKKAWIPIAIGTLGWVSLGLITAQITTWTSLMMYIFTGISSGGIASSGRDLWVGK